MSEQERDSIERQMLETVRQIESEYENRADPQQYLQGRSRVDSITEKEGFRISFIRQRESADKQNSPFFVLLHVLQLMLCELQGGVLSMRDVLGITKKPAFEEFKTFLQCVEVYGGGYLDDVDFQKFNNRSKETHQQAEIVQLK